MAPLLQVPLLHASVVQASPSLQSAGLLQQLASRVWRHAPVGPQLSVVQLLPSSHPPTTQVPAVTETGAEVPTLPARSVTRAIKVWAPGVRLAKRPKLVPLLPLLLKVTAPSTNSSLRATKDPTSTTWAWITCTPAAT